VVSHKDSSTKTGFGTIEKANDLSIQEMDAIVKTLRKLRPYWHLDESPFPMYSSAPEGYESITERLDEILEVFEKLSTCLHGLKRDSLGVKIYLDDTEI
jgi:hypothetical protein